MPNSSFLRAAFAMHGARRSRQLVWVALAALVALLAGCAQLPPVRPDAPSSAIQPGAQTRLGAIARDSLPAGDAAVISGFRLLPEGGTAFNARIALTRNAQQSVDAMYYLIASDRVGLQFLRELRDAAARGVRVRLIVDDIYAGGEDPLLAGLAAFPNVEVRLFNPLPSRSSSLVWRVLRSADDFERINRRMHNKLFVADNAVSVSGGRNMANPYFMQSREANFIDLDVLSTGAVVPKLSAVFDSFWNSPQVRPVDQLAAPASAAERRARFDALVAQAGEPVTERPRDILGAVPVAQQLAAGRLVQTIATARVFADSPAKALGFTPAVAEVSVNHQTMALFAEAREQVRIVSPYFIPGERGMAMMRKAGATQANGRIVLVTNSLGSTDEPLAYAEYAKYRKAMLEAGVQIFELGPELSRMTDDLGGAFHQSISRLHAKVAVIDERLVFIGSMNLDGRSALENTEIGVVIDSHEIAYTVADLLGQRLAAGAYRLRLSPEGNHTEWIATEADGSQKIHRVEPGDDWRYRLQFWLLLPLVNQDLF
ncbi:phospholipase D family protein [Variovorax sp. J22P168]|uniref:phospholipase D-like domain-containing protein n=1 Tax=Variovorax jilinensis TaxID=3053513 RepID=UPI0025750DE0|nr:phospholipase D family protein [Variovorax sp. J22P168]MDM0011629.1 phospholipase D family protein [Variovorax sp. J22P168]